MIRSKELTDRKIVARDSGQQIQELARLVFDFRTDRVLAMLVDKAGWFSDAKVIAWPHVVSIGEEAIMVDVADCVIKGKEDEAIHQALEAKVDVYGLKMLTASGEEVGRIADVLIDPTDGRILGYEATGGFFADMTSGRSFVPVRSGIQIGADVALISAEAWQAMQEKKTGGLQGAWQSVTGKVRDAYDDLAQASRDKQTAYVVGKTAASELRSDDGRLLVAKGATITAADAHAAEASGKLAALLALATGGVVTDAAARALRKAEERWEDLKEAGVEKQKAFVVGKVAGAEVHSESGEWIVGRGDTITAAQADRAEATGSLMALLAAAGKGSIGLGQPQDAAAEGAAAPADTLADTLAGKAAGAAAAASGAAVAAKEGAGELLGKAKNWLQDKRRDVDEALARREAQAEAARIQAALGRPVQRVVLAPDDRVLLQVGDLVTNKAVEEARSLGVLGLLLDSVSA